MNIYTMLADVEGVFDGIPIPKEPLQDSNVQAVVGFFFVLVGIIAVIMVIVGGFQYATSTGDPQKTKKAKDTILYALIGLVISISAWTIVNFILDKT